MRPLPSLTVPKTTRPDRNRAIIIAAFLLLLINGPAAARADNDENTLFTADPGTQALPVSPEPNRHVPGFLMGTLDRYHAALQSRVNQPVLWFDGFFGDARTDDQDWPETLIRLGATARYTEGEGFTSPILLRANIKLPKASERLRLIFSGVNEDELRQGKDQAGFLDSATGAREETGNSTRLGLRYTLYKTLRSIFNFDIGLSLDWPIESYIRMRYRRFIHIGRNNIIRFTETGFYNTIIGPGTTSRFDFERTLPHEIGGRISLFGTYSKESHGVDWGAETTLFKKLSPKTAVSFDLGAYGETRPAFETDTYRISARLRRNFLRPWLYFELEPEVTFPLQDDDSRKAVGAVSMMLEVQFVGEKYGSGE